MSEVSVGVYPKNTIPFKVYKGTRYSNTVITLTREHADSTHARNLYTKSAIDQVVKAYEEKFGALRWDQCEFSITHLTFQIAVELRVRDESQW